MTAKEAIDKIIDYNWKDELRNFEETFEVEIQSQDSIKSWIPVIELTENERSEQMRNHIFYSLMVLKYQFQKLE